MTSMDFVVLMVRFRTLIYCFVDELLGYVTSSSPQMNIRNHLRCLFERGKDIVWSGSRPDWENRANKSLLQFHFSLTLNQVYLRGEVSRKLVCCSTVRPISDGSECRFFLRSCTSHDVSSDDNNLHSASFLWNSESRLTLKVEEAGTFETSVNICYATRRHIPEGSILVNHHHGNLRSERRSLVGTLWIAG
jgi:hypothetical protein